MEGVIHPTTVRILPVSSDDDARLSLGLPEYAAEAKSLLQDPRIANCGQFLRLRKSATVELKRAHHTDMGRMHHQPARFRMADRPGKMVDAKRQSFSVFRLGSKS